MVILKRKQLQQKIGLGHNAIHDRLNPNSPRYDPTFPKPLRIGDSENSALGFLEEEVNAWIAQRVKLSRGESSRGGQQ